MAVSLLTYEKEIILSALYRLRDVNYAGYDDCVKYEMNGDKIRERLDQIDSLIVKIIEA